MYNPLYRIFRYRTAAITLASKGIIPPDQLYHDPNIQDNQGYTVATHLFMNGKEIP